MHMETEILPVHHNLFPESLPFCRWGAGANIDKGSTIKPFIYGEFDYLHLVPSDKRDHRHRGRSQFAHCPKSCRSLPRSCDISIRFLMVANVVVGVCAASTSTASNSSF